MEIVEQTLCELEDLYRLIAKTYENFKKCPKVRLTRGYVTVKLQSVEEYWNQFRLAHTTLMKSVTKEQRKLLPYFEQNQYFICEEQAMQAKSDMKDLLFTIESQQKSTRQETHYTSSTTQSPEVKLPRIEIPKFSGNYEAWPTFQDLFISLVDRNNTISGVQKLHYLKTSVTGEAELLLRHIQINEANYTQAWETLKRRYSNKRLIVTSLLKRMFSQKKLTSQNPSHIRSLIDTTSECLNSLKNMNIRTDDWDPLINYLVVQKLDTDTHKEWEEHVSNQGSEELPTFESLKMFLESKFRTLELVQQPTSSKERIVRSYHTSGAATEKTCPLCEETHTLSHCKDFGKMEPEQRSEFVKSKYICYNCLVPGHRVIACRLLTKCRLCQRRHHTLLHSKRSNDASGPTERNDTKQPKVLHANVDEESESGEEINLAVMTSQTNTTHSTAVALLATALVECKSEDGHTTVLRALIDPGSQGCFISERAAQTIRARRYPVKGSIVGVGEVKSRLKQVVQIEVSSRNEEFSLRVKAYVIAKQLTTQIPTQKIPTNNWNHLDGLTLADPKFSQPANIDLLLGVNEYAQIIQSEVIKGPPGSPIAQRTTLGWILFGKVNDCEDVREESIIVMHQQIEMEDMLKTLWEVDTDMNRKLTKEEENCERIYKENYTRTEEGRYIVKLPFKTETPQSVEGNTYNIAMKRLQMLERRFDRQPELEKNYKEVMEEYIRLNHMQEVPQNELNNKSVYLPHHAVVRTEKETTKTRVVFDASCKGSNNISLNDELMNGPVLQEDLRSIIMRWRMHKVCFVSDIEKMYRMILIQKEDADFQRVLWRQNTSISDEVKHYRLLTVTFGTASAPYLAIKTLMQLSEDEGEDHPIAKRIIREDFYVDDVMSGCDTVKEAIEASKQLKTVLSKGKFRLQKWCSNSPEFLKSLDEGEKSAKAHIDMKLDGIVKALGVSWDLENDEFKYNLNLPAQFIDITKRDLLSDLQKLFDPL
ncbi:uncharacterized protein LOC114351044, partial [Ostrinia furnacalis]|uniref:uncharacterized protein LOC114351044 n=1 Tax=Ostrinia furnacalis TaxID=93504 RepID=UPI00103C77E7